MSYRLYADERATEARSLPSLFVLAPVRLSVGHLLLHTNEHSLSGRHGYPSFNNRVAVADEGDLLTGLKPIKLFDRKNVCIKIISNMHLMTSLPERLPRPECQP